MRLSLLMSAAALCLSLPAMAQNSVNTQTPPSPFSSASPVQSPNDVPPGSATAVQTRPGGVIGRTGAMPMAAPQGGMAPPVAPSGMAQGGMAPQGGTGDDMTGMQPMRQPSGGAMAAQPRRMRHRHPANQGMGGMDEATGARPGHEPGVGDSEPASANASNIRGADTRSDIAPRLPVPNVDNGSPESYLAAADRALARRQTGAAQEALERAETRMLDRSVPMGQGGAPDRDPRVDQVNSALQALANRNYAGARQSIQQAMGMGGPGMGGPGMGGGMGGGGMMQPGMGAPPPSGMGLPR